MNSELLCEFQSFIFSLYVYVHIKKRQISSIRCMHNTIPCSHKVLFEYHFPSCIPGILDLQNSLFQSPTAIFNFLKHMLRFNTYDFFILLVQLNRFVFGCSFSFTISFLVFSIILETNNWNFIDEAFIGVQCQSLSVLSFMQVAFYFSDYRKLQKKRIQKC